MPSDVALENSADGAEAYAYFLFQAWWYLINTHDIDWWDANIPDCEWKEILRGAAVEATDKGAANELAAFVPRTMDRRVNPENPSEFAITLQAEVGPIFEISSTGKRVESAEKRDQELIARLLHNGNNWEAVAIVTREAGEAP
ncbi:hypothetical protein ABYF34_05840 [Buchananella felis]|uniref:hypothetical protein n=1 Tax=Buchananella felis TaxID=3231492 RepID=UPI003528C3AB